MNQILKITAALLFVVVLSSCGNKKKAPKTDNHTEEIPVALQEQKSFSYSRGGDILEQLYAELLEQDQTLVDIEKGIELLNDSKGDSVKSYEEYTRKVDQYYNVARRKLLMVRDSAMRKVFLEVIDNSDSAYKLKIKQHKAYYDNIPIHTARLTDLHALLKVVKTLPLIEKYQETNKPSTDPLKGYLNRVDSMMIILEHHVLK